MVGGIPALALALMSKYVSLWALNVCPIPGIPTGIPSWATWSYKLRWIPAGGRPALLPGDWGRGYRLRGRDRAPGPVFLRPRPRTKVPAAVSPAAPISPTGAGGTVNPLRRQMRNPNRRSRARANKRLDPRDRTGLKAAGAAEPAFPP